MREREREIIGRPIDNVSVKSTWSASNFQNFVYNVQWGLCKIEIGLWYHKIYLHSLERERKTCSHQQEHFKIYNKKKQITEEKRNANLPKNFNDGDTCRQFWHGC